MHFSALFTFVAAAAAGMVAAQTLTAPFQCAGCSAYTLCQNLWGESSGTGGQNSTLISCNDNGVSWRTVWNWQGGSNNVKSYANIMANNAKGLQLASIGSAPTTWNWRYEAENNVRADVSYDIWFGWGQNGTPASSASSYEIMIWLSSQGGVQPIGSVVAWNVGIAGHSWNVWKGPNENWQVLSFVSTSGDITNFNADLNEFFKYLQSNQGVSQWQYVQAIQTGTEPFTGSASLLTNTYSVALNHN